MAQKKKFEVNEGESIEACLDRMKTEGYMPVRRLEQPIFHEIVENGKVKQVVLRQQVVFEGKPL